MGSHVQSALEVDGHEVVGLEAKPLFGDWSDEMYAVMETPIDAVVHAGAISSNQSQDPNIGLWNGHATFLLVQRVRQKMYSMSPIPLVFFFSFVVEDDIRRRTPYGWSKAMGEAYVHAYLPHASILRPSVIWGDERVRKSTGHGSLAYRLASHDLQYLIKDWLRYYIHVSDVVRAVITCLEDRCRGTFSLADAIPFTNKELADLISWKGYEWIDDPVEAGLMHYRTTHARSSHKSAWIPNWEPQVDLREELPRLEQEIHQW